MTVAELIAAAEKIEKAARQRADWAKQAEAAFARSLHSEVARQFTDCALQTRAWARALGLYARHGIPVPADILAGIEGAVREYLTMAGSGVDDG